MGVKHVISVTCEACEQRIFSPGFQEIRCGQCSGCGGSSWTLRMRLIFPQKMEVNWGESALGVGLMALTGVGFTSTTVTDGYQRLWVVQRVPATDLNRLIMFTRDQDLIHEIGAYVKARETWAQVEYERLVGARGAHCLICRAVFLPRTEFERAGLAPPEQSSDHFCSAPCLQRYEENSYSARCKRCGQRFALPRDPAGASARPWHAEGFCRLDCQMNRNGEKGCLVCAKTYSVSKVNYLPIHKQIIEWQKAGICSKKCHEKAERDGLSAEPEAVDAANILIACPGQHQLKVPAQNQGLFVLCPTCKTRFAIPRILDPLK